MPHPTCMSVFAYEAECGAPAVAAVRFHDPPEVRLLCLDCSLRAMRLLLGTGHVFTIASEPAPSFEEPPRQQIDDPGPQHPPDEHEEQGL